MRGKGHAGALAHAVVGITPAYAGKSFSGVDKNLMVWDHPRLCGEKCKSNGGAVGRRGSPPPMRGKDTSAASVMPSWGITPAYAGKSFHSSPDSAGQRDHPRLCGEKHTWGCDTCILVGSPPPMRGKGSVFWQNIVRKGITPAYAGKSWR